MGAWGIAILSDDVAADVYSDYMDDYDDGLDRREIRSKLEKKYAEALNDNEDGPPFWFALANAQWKCGVLDADLLSRVKDIVSSGVDLNRWTEQGEKTRAKRQAVLDTFITTIGEPNPKPRKRKKAKHILPIFNPGDCLAITLTEGIFGAALVLANQETRWGNSNLIGVLRYRSSNLPTLAVFEKREWLPLTFHKWGGTRIMRWCGAGTFKNTKNAVSLIGQVSLKPSDPTDLNHMEAHGNWDIAEEIELQFASERG